MPVWGNNWTTTKPLYVAYARAVVRGGANMNTNTLALRVLLLLALLPASAVHAATFTVNSVADKGLAQLPTACAAGSECTLRAAIQLANASPGADTIVFDLALDGTPLMLAIPNGSPGGEFDAAEGDLNIRDDLTITGNGAGKTIIQGGASLATSVDRVFEVGSAKPVTVTISGVTIRYGKPPSSVGGGILLEGASVLTISDSVISDNAAQEGGGGGGGGVAVIFSGSELLLDRVTFARNTAIEGGALSYPGTGKRLVITNSTFSDNRAESSTLGLETAGGALSTGTGTLLPPTVMPTIVNSTFSGNLAGRGCAIFASDGEMRLFNVTVANNCTPGSPASAIVVAPSENRARLVLRNSILSGPAGTTNCQVAPFNASITSQGHNLSSDGSCGLFGPGDMQFVNPSLGPLAFNGGPTRTHALLAGSPAIDAGEPGCTNPDGIALTSDQRGQPRPVGAACDIGAYEVQRALGGSSATIPSATGAGSVTFATSAGTFGSLDPIAEADVPPNGKPAGVTFPFGLFSWTLTGLGPGQSAIITMTYPSPIPASVQYWKVVGDQWTNLTPLLGSNDGDNVLTLTITDGGLGDADGAANGQISDPGGIAVPSRPAVVPFATFNAELEIEHRDFELEAAFTLGAASNGINPVTEDVTLSIGTFSTTVHAGAFKADKKGKKFTFKGVIDGTRLKIEIHSLGGRRFEIEAKGNGANVRSTRDPVSVSLTIGDDSGTTAVKADREDD